MFPNADIKISNSLETCFFFQLKMLLASSSRNQPKWHFLKEISKYFEVYHYFVLNVLVVCPFRKV